MCSTCNYKEFSKNEADPNNTYLEQSLGFGSLIIRCDLKGKNYKIAVKDDPKSGFTIYRCPTCGKNLY